MLLIVVLCSQHRQSYLCRDQIYSFGADWWFGGVCCFLISQSPWGLTFTFTPRIQHISSVKDGIMEDASSRAPSSDIILRGG